MCIRIFSRWGRQQALWTACFSAIFLLSFSAAVAFAQEPTETPETAPEITPESAPEVAPESMPVTPPTAKRTSWLEFLIKGGLTMIPIALCSIGFIAIVAVKLSIFRLMRFRISNFSEELTESVSSGHIDEAIELCTQADNPVTRPLQKGLMIYKSHPSRVADTLREAMLDEMPGLESYIGWLGIIAGIAPLLGLFGTVVGIIQAFIQLAAGGAVTDPTSFMLLADGIYKALITTAAGLFVGIPALVMYEYFRMKIADLMRDMDKVSVSLLNALGIGLGGQS